jgi:uncharacterized protein YdeI (YjbR/CyaY-like superfamily)
MKTPDQPHRFSGREEWRAWLQENHATQSEAWLVILKSSMSMPGVYYDEAVEEAVCFGWIDGLTKRADAGSFLQRFTPRKRGSVWSVSNIKRVERLTAQGKMTEAGMAKVREAMQNGEWEAATRREDTSNLPEDLLEALNANAAAQENFEQYPASQKKQLLYWIFSAKTEATRQKRIHKLVEMAASNKRLGEE